MLSMHGNNGPCTPFDTIHVILAIPNDSPNKCVVCIEVDIKPLKFVNLTFVLGVVFSWFILGIGHWLE